MIHQVPDCVFSCAIDVGNGFSLLDALAPPAIQYGLLHFLALILSKSYHTFCLVIVMFDGARAMLPCLEGMALRTKQRI